MRKTGFWKPMRGCYPTGDEMALELCAGLKQAPKQHTDVDSSYREMM